MGWVDGAAELIAQSLQRELARLVIEPRAVHQQSRGLADRDQPLVGVQDFEGLDRAYYEPISGVRGVGVMSSRKRPAPHTKSPRGATPFTRVRRLSESGAYDAAAIYGVLDAATHCHVAHVVDGRPIATPTLHWRVGDRVYWHGSVASRLMKTNALGAEVCLTVTIFDGWVLARSAFNHSANYRSVMCFGRPDVIDAPAEKSRLLEAFTEHWFPGRWARLRPVSRKELGATLLLSMPIDLASAKIRDGGVGDPARDLPWPVWAGVVPLSTTVGRPIDDAGLAPGLPRPKTRAPGRSAPALKPQQASRRRPA